MISKSDALKGVHSRYSVAIKTLTYKGYDTGDIPMIWGTHRCIYDKDFREKYATKEMGLDRDYTAEEMNTKFLDLCTDFGLTKEGDYVPVVKKSKWNFFSSKSKKDVVFCDDF